MERVLDDYFVVGLHRAGAKKFIKDRIGNPDDEECARIRRWFMLRMNGKVWEHGMPLRCRAPDNVPELRSHPVWPREEFDWIDRVDAMHGTIMEELLGARAASREAGDTIGFQPYRDQSGADGKPAEGGLGVEATDTGAWNVCYLYLNHKRFEDNCARFPATIKAIEECFPRHYSHAFFSALTPGAHIMKHTGPSNRMLRVWLPLCGLEGFRIRVNDTIVRPEEGRAFVWDHSYEHEAWHEGDVTRIVLIVDIWHPDLANAEVKFLSTLTNCRLRAGRILAEECKDRSAEDATYFDIVERARHLLTDDEWWIIKAEKDPTTRPT